MEFLRRETMRPPARTGLLARLLIVVLMGAPLVIVSSQPAFAACSFDTDNDHTVGSVFHGWDRLFCQPANDYRFTAFTNHGHGTKHAALWHVGATHLHCDSLASGSSYATCTDTVNNTNHETFHDRAGVSCTDSFNDGHGFNCHFVESLP